MSSVLASLHLLEVQMSKFVDGNLCPANGAGEAILVPTIKKVGAGPSHHVEQACMTIDVSAAGDNRVLDGVDT